MKNKNPILVLTGLAIVAVAAVAGLTRDQWMAEKTEAVATPEAAQPAQQPAGQQQAAAPAAEAPAETGPAPEQPAGGSQQATTEPPPGTPSEEPVAEAPAGAQPAPNGAAGAEVPAFDTVRVEKTGEAVIAGTAKAGSEVVVKLDGAEIGRAKANNDGAFVVVPEKPLPQGSGALTLESRAQDEQAPTASEQSVAVIVPAGGQEPLVAVVSPDEPTRVLQKPAEEPAGQPAQEPAQEQAAAPAAEVAPETAAAQPSPAAEPAAAESSPTPAKLVSIDAVDYDSSGNIVFSGQGEKGNTARVYVDNSFIGDAPVGEDGRWSFSGTAEIKPGVHTLRVDGLDAKGNVVNRVEVPFVREDHARVAEATQAPAPAPAAETAGGTVATEGEPAAEASPPAQPEAPAAAAPSVEASSQPVTTAQPEAQTEAAAIGEPAQAEAPATPKEGRVVIQPGNNLWRISRVLYGSGTKYTLLYEANKDQIRNPNLIYPGQVFKTPEVAPKTEAIDPKRRDPLTPEENAAGVQ
ncbi:LysM peptidoglycan-binding domain-containing protein [Aestuariivirga sp.]|uniref:LysM peptidoglycan-binding domain-containing protein n=1 Tax=Aestuariivirga sp. TaxID=2650926 RepID=UPI00391A7032